MKPTLNDIIYDPVLTNMAVGYSNAEYIAEKVLPRLPSKHITGKYYQYDQSRFRKENSLRAPGTKAKRIGYGMSLGSAYECKDHALDDQVPDEIVSHYPTHLDAFKDATEAIQEKLLVEKEYDLATYMANTANLTNNTTLSGTDQWSDYSNSDPIGDIETGIESVRSNLFIPANTLVLGQQTWNKLKHHPDLLERVKYSKLGKVDPSMLVDLIDGIKYVYIGGAGYNSANEGQSDSMSYIWGKHAWLLYVTDRPGIKQVSFGYHMQYNGQKRGAFKWYDKPEEATYVRVHDFYTREIVTVNAAYLIKNAVA